MVRCFLVNFVIFGCVLIFLGTLTFEVSWRVLVLPENISICFCLVIGGAPNPGLLKNKPLGVNFRPQFTFSVNAFPASPLHSPLPKQNFRAPEADAPFCPQQED